MVCAICGETSHLTRDCPQRHDKKKMEESRQRDHAYLEFMDELEGRKRVEEKAATGSERRRPGAGDDMEIDEEGGVGVNGNQGYVNGNQGYVNGNVNQGYVGNMNQSIAMSGNGNPQPIIRPGMIGYAQQPLNMNWQQQSLRRKRSCEVRGRTNDVLYDPVWNDPTTTEQWQIVVFVVRPFVLFLQVKSWRRRR